MATASWNRAVQMSFPKICTKNSVHENEGATSLRLFLTPFKYRDLLDRGGQVYPNMTHLNQIKQWNTLLGIPDLHYDCMNYYFYWWTWIWHAWNNWNICFMKCVIKLFDLYMDWAWPTWLPFLLCDRQWNCMYCKWKRIQITIQCTIIRTWLRP